MGVWAVDAFGNDTACEWADDFSENPSLDNIKNAINCVIDSEGFLGCEEAYEGLVACEIVARLKGNWGGKSGESEKIDKWVESVSIQPSEELIVTAEKAIARILDQDSEVQELWAGEVGKTKKWHSEMNALLARVKS